MGLCLYIHLGYSFNVIVVCYRYSMGGGIPSPSRGIVGNKPGLQFVSRPVEQIIGFFIKI